MRRALVVGIDGYPTSPLSGCVNDAKRIGQLLSKNDDGSPNFDCRYLLAPHDEIERRDLSTAIDDLLATEADIVVFFFSGHGALDTSGGYLLTPDARAFSDGYPMASLLACANKSRVREFVAFLDCCHSGEFGNLSELGTEQTALREGIAILAASRSSESSLEVDGSGVFTTLVCDALQGGAADVLGQVTTGSIYAYVDLALSAWDQRPIFKAYLSRFSSLRRCKIYVDPAVLRLLPSYFEDPQKEYPLDPSYEPDLEPKNERNERTFTHLQKLRDARMLVPVGEQHLYYAAVNSKSCKLTPLGQFYWHLAKRERI
jgi:uncharacterized caspase-like protein